MATLLSVAVGSAAQGAMTWNGTAASAPTAATASDAPTLAARPLVPAVNVAEVEAMAQPASGTNPHYSASP